ncbi:hypothetical protein RSAG8_00174, partial [Rhizoctonia solani AG-8 WAC10335]
GAVARIGGGLAGVPLPLLNVKRLDADDFRRIVGTRVSVVPVAGGGPADSGTSVAVIEQFL